VHTRIWLKQAACSRDITQYRRRYRAQYSGQYRKSLLGEIDKTTHLYLDHGRARFRTRMLRQK
jgi:hypothetical protein